MELHSLASPKPELIFAQVLNAFRRFCGDFRLLTGGRVVRDAVERHAQMLSRDGPAANPLAHINRLPPVQEDADFELCVTGVQPGGKLRFAGFAVFNVFLQITFHGFLHSVETPINVR